MSKRIAAVIGLLLVCAGVILAGLTVWSSVFPAQTALPSAAPSPTPSPTAVVSTAPVPEATPEPEAEASPDSSDGLPVGKLVVTAERKTYEDGALTLRIPALDVTRTVHDGTDDEDLASGVGLYEYAQLPGSGNRNVSIAGHRNGISNGKVTDRAPFYYIDTLTDGDYLYLTDGTHIYRYVWESTYVVEADDWSPIYTTGESCLTITSCHPIGVSDHRIVARAALDEIFDYDSNFDYTAAREEASS